MMTKKTGYVAALLLAGVLAIPVVTEAAENTVGVGEGGHAAAAQQPQTKEEPQKTQMHMGSAEEKNRKAEIQMDYLKQRGARRHIDLYNLHVFRQYKEMHGMSLHWGVTVSRPAYMVRWTKPLGKKWEASFDATGAVLVYNKVHPAHTRNYGFMWRIGPRLTYNFNDRNALSIAYLGHHVSNGQRTKNPGYNGVGLSIGYRYSY